MQFSKNLLRKDNKYLKLYRIFREGRMYNACIKMRMSTREIAVKEKISQKIDIQKQQVYERKKEYEKW